jgi:hypothetical protein
VIASIVFFIQSRSVIDIVIVPVPTRVIGVDDPTPRALLLFWCL